MTTYAPTRAHLSFGRLATYLMVVGVSLIAVAALLLFHELALMAVLVLTLVALTVWRPRYGIYAVLLLTLPLDPDPQSPVLGGLGAAMQTAISASTSMQMLVFSPIELLLVVATLVVVVGGLLNRRPLRAAQLQLPLLLFLVLLVGSIVWGLATGGLFNIALQETRGMASAVIVALLVPQVMPRRGQMHHIMNLLLMAIVVLSIDIIWRRYTYLADSEYLDLAFNHDTPIFMNFAVILLLARQVWPATVRQRLVALVIPLILFAEMVTERRAGWVSLDVALVLVTIFVFRLRRKVFYFVALPLMLIYVGYLAAFWNATGPIAQPARAVRSINDPEGRDEASNYARISERLNIQLNIRSRPITGLGFGQQYIFYVPMPDLSFWPLWHYVAHTQLLWLWMKAGPLAFITFLTICGAAIVRGVQLLKLSSNDQSAPYLVAVVCGLLMIIVYSYVDIAFNSPRVMALMGFVLGVIGSWGTDAATAREGRR